MSLTMVNGKAHKMPMCRPPRETAGPIIAPGQQKGGPKEACPLETRRLAARAHLQNNNNNQVIIEGQLHANLPSRRSVHRHTHRCNNLGHLQAFRRSGNRRSAVFKGLDQVLLILHNKKFPHASAFQKIAFIFNSWGVLQAVPRAYDESQVTRAEQRLGLSRKRCAVSAIKAFSRPVLIRRMLFWTQPCPIGIADVPRSCMIDLDEARIAIDQVNKRFGKAKLAERVRTVGHCKGEGRLLLAAISGNIDGRRWLRIEGRAGTTLPLFVQFMTQILAASPPGNAGNR